MVDVRTELAHIQRQLDWYQKEHGEVVIWYELDGKASRYHDVFHTHGKVYRPPIAVPVIWVIYDEPVQESFAEGRRSVATAQLAINYHEFRSLGISDPTDYERHLNDMFAYQGEYFSIGEYALLGRLARDDVIVSVNGIRIYPEEELIASEIPDAAYVAEAMRPSLGLNADLAPEYVYYPPPSPQGVCTGTISGSFSWSTGELEAFAYGFGPYGSGPYGGAE